MITENAYPFMVPRIIVSRCGLLDIFTELWKGSIALKDPSVALQDTAPTTCSTYSKPVAKMKVTAIFFLLSICKCRQNARRMSLRTLERILSNSSSSPGDTFSHCSPRFRWISVNALDRTSCLTQPLSRLWKAPRKSHFWHSVMRS